MTAMAAAANVKLLFDPKLTTIKEVIAADPANTDYWNAADEHMYSMLVKLISGEQLESTILNQSGFIEAWTALCDKNEAKHASSAGIYLWQLAAFMMTADNANEDPDNAAADLRRIAQQCKNISI